MAGHRRQRDGELKRHAGARRRRERHQVEQAAAVTDQDRVMAAADYVRAALTAHPDPAEAAKVVAFLTDAGHRINEGRSRDGDRQ